MINSINSIIKKTLVVAIVAVAVSTPVASAASATLVPSCTISAVPNAITSAQSATLRWDSTDGAIFARIDNGIGSIAPDGTMTVSPNVSTVYTLHSWNSQGEGGYCSTTLTVDGNGFITSANQPTVTMRTLAIHPASTRVVLSSVPYTGAAENILYTFFLLTVVLTAGYVAKTRKRTLFV